jgi:ABC-type glycerol-3-phosphate transport system substrate-binding protein
MQTRTPHIPRRCTRLRFRLTPFFVSLLVWMTVIVTAAAFPLYSRGERESRAEEPSSGLPDRVLTLKLNGSVREITHTELFRGAGTAATPDGNPVTAAVLAEQLPLMFDLWEFSVTDESGAQFDLLEPASVDRLFETHLYYDKQQLVLVHNGKTVRGAAEITVAGDPLPLQPLEVWVSWEGTRELAAIISRFSERFGISISTHDIPGTASKLTVHNRGGMQIPDVVMVQSDHLPQLLSEQALQPILWELPPAFQQKGAEAFTTDNLYAVPFSADVQVICYNPELLPAPYGSSDGSVSGTLAELEEALASVPAPAVPAAWNIYSAYWLIPFQLGFGKETLLEPDLSIRVNDRATVDAVSYLMHLLGNGLVSSQERDSMTSQFIRGEVGMILTGSYALGGLLELNIPLSVAVYPFNEETGQYVSPLIDYKGFAVPKKSRNPIAARRLIQYLSSPAVQAEFSFSHYKNPVRDDVWQLSALPPEFSEVLRASMEIGAVIPPQPAYGISKDTMWKMIHLILSGEMPVQEGLDTAQQIIDNQLQRLELPL